MNPLKTNRFRLYKITSTIGFSCIFYDQKVTLFWLLSSCPSMQLLTERACRIESTAALLSFSVVILSLMLTISVKIKALCEKSSKFQILIRPFLWAWARFSICIGRNQICKKVIFLTWSSFLDHQLIFCLKLTFWTLHRLNFRELLRFF